MEMNILFSSDDNYARHLGVAMYSLMVHNYKATKLNFVVVDNCISEENKEKLRTVVSQFDNSTLLFISFEKYIVDLQLDMPWPISLSAYARLFAAEMLPKEMDRVLYLDCDMVINHDLSCLWMEDLKGKCIGAIQDQVKTVIKTDVGLSSSDPYFNSGLLLVDLALWRSQKIGQRVKEFIISHKGRITHHDQGVLNGVLCNNWTRLPLQYNVMTIHYLLRQKTIVHYFKDYTSFYSTEEIEAAINNPWLIHYTPSFTSRPWEENCHHPLRLLYSIFLSKTPWNGYQKDEERISLYLRWVNWRYRNFCN